MNVDLLKIFADVAQKGSFSEVARVNDVNPSSISRSITALEDELKLRLFHRNTRNVNLTEAGKVYYDRVLPLIEELENSRLLASDIEKVPNGVLRVSSPVSYAELAIVPVLPEFLELYPEISIDLILTDSKLDLLSDNIDVSIRLGTLNDSSLIAYKFSPMISFICASPNYIGKYGNPDSIDDLRNHNCLKLSMPDFPAKWKFRDSVGKITEIEVSGNVTTSNALALKTCALNDIGITMQACWMVVNEINDGSLINLFPEYDVTMAGWDAGAWLLYPSRRYLPLKVRAFVDFIKKSFSDNQHLGRHIENCTYESK